VREAYARLRDRLSWLLRFLAEAETLLQNIAYAHSVLVPKRRPGAAAGGVEPAVADRAAVPNRLHPDTPPAPSFFNAHNLARPLPVSTHTPGRGPSRGPGTRRGDGPGPRATGRRRAGPQPSPPRGRPRPASVRGWKNCTSCSPRRTAATPRRSAPPSSRR